MNKEKKYALFDDKDIMFDAFVEDLADDRLSTFSTDLDAVCFIKGMPVYMYCMYCTKDCYINCFSNLTDSVLNAINEEFVTWNRTSEREKDCGIQFIWKCKKENDSTIVINAEKIIEN